MTDSKSPFHRGEREIQDRLGIREQAERLGRRMISDHISVEDQAFFAQLPLLFVGSLDAAQRPWVSVLAGRPGFIQAPDEKTLRLKGRTVYGDPLGQAVAAGADLGILGIDFLTRDRSRVNGKITRIIDDGFELGVRQSFGNCPKYIQARQLVEADEAIDAIGQSRSVHRGDSLNREEAALIARSDTFFIASQYTEAEGDWTHGVDVSHRGGRPGFVLVAHESELLFPDYTGNCMFNTLGNILVNPRCGLLFLDFDSGDTLQVTGEATILWEPHHTQRFPGAERVVSFNIEEIIRTERALPLSWRFESYSSVFDDFVATDAGAVADAGRSDMRLISVNLSKPKPIVHQDKTVLTGIGKQPVEQRVMLRWLNLDGDGQADLWGHGGAFRAVYVYSIENYAYWRRELEREHLPYGQFGENFTVEGMPDDEVCIGDVYRIGGALIEVSQPRIPCNKLAIRMGIDGFEKRFLKSGRVGFYGRVLEEGEVGRDDLIQRISQDARGLTVKEVSNLLYFDTQNIEATQKALSIPALSHGWKGSFAERLNKTKMQPQTSRGFCPMVVDRKVAESETITSFYLKPQDGAALAAFVPGQFLTFELTLPGRTEPLLRTYSLSASPNPDYYRVSIKRELPPSDQPGLDPGLASTFFHDHVDLGAILSVGPPRGKFRLDLDSDRAVVLLSAGVGLTPMVAMLNTLVELNNKRPVWYVHGCRNGREHAMGAPVRQLVSANKNVQAHIRYSSPDPTDIAGRDYDSRGRIDVDLLKQILPFDDYDFYLCGPLPFMRSLYCSLLALGVKESRIHYEFFGPTTTLTDAAGPSDPAATTRPAEEEVTGQTQVTFRRSGVEVAWDPTCESILDLAEKHGVSPSYSCRSGICNTCACELIEGEVEYVDEPLSTPKPGYVLICCSRPQGNLVIDA